MESDTTEQLYLHFPLSCIGEGTGNPVQCSCLENPRDGGAWWAAIYGVAQSHWSDLAAVAAAIYLLAQGVMNSSRMQEMWVWSLGQEGPWRREWLPRPVFLLGEFHRQRSLERYGPWDCKESDMTERLILLFFKLFTEQDMKTMI